MVRVDPDNRTVGISAPCSIHADVDCYIDKGISMLYVGEKIPREIAAGVPRKALHAKDSNAFAAAVVGEVCSACPGFEPGDFRSDPLAARRLLHATTATELGVAEHRPGVEPLIDYLSIGAAPAPVHAWYKRLLNNPPQTDVREAVRSMCGFLLGTDEACPQLPAPHLGNIVRSLRAREATPRLLSEIRVAIAQVKTVVENFDPQAIEWMKLVVEESARVGEVTPEDLGCAIERIDLSLEPDLSYGMDQDGPGSGKFTSNLLLLVFSGSTLTYSL